MNEKMRVNLSELLPIIDEQLKSGKDVCFSPNGVSMLPMLVPGRDSVVLKSPPLHLKKYDLPLYRRADGKFVLHRVVKSHKDGTYTMCGDNQHVREHGVKHSQVIGIVTEFSRKNKTYSCKNPLYRLYAVFRVEHMRLFHTYVFIRQRLKKLIKK